MLNEKHLIKQIQSLKQIRPRKEWVDLCKKEILGEQEKFGFQWLFKPIQRQTMALAFRSMAVAVVVLAGGFFYLYYLNFQGSNGIPAKVFIVENQQEQNQKLVNALKDLQSNLNKINTSLNNLKNSTNKKQSLAMIEVIKVAANKGEQAIKDIKDKNSSSKQVLASLIDVENDFKQLEQDSYDIQTQMLEDMLQDLEGRTLSVENQERLQKAKQYYNDKKYNEAMILVIKIME